MVITIVKRRARWVKSQDMMLSCNRYSWDFGDGAAWNDNDKNTVSHEYAQDGTYTVNVSVWEYHGNEAVCFVFSNIILNVGEEL